MAKTVKAAVLRDFNVTLDIAGNIASFKANSTVTLDEGEFENYRYAGLVRAADEAPAKAAPAT